MTTTARAARLPVVSPTTTPPTSAVIAGGIQPTKSSNCVVPGSSSAVDARGPFRLEPTFVTRRPLPSGGHALPGQPRVQAGHGSPPARIVPTDERDRRP